jgi:hypothetical protein
VADRRHRGRPRLAAERSQAGASVVDEERRLFPQQGEQVDTLAEGVHLLGGVSVAMAHDVAGLTLIPRPPKGREGAAAQIARLLQAWFLAGHVVEAP